MNLTEVQELTKAAVAGVLAGQLYEGVRHFGIDVRSGEAACDTVSDIRRLVVPAPGDALMPLDNIVEIWGIVGPRQHVREESRRDLEIQSNGVGRDIGGFAGESQAVMDSAISLPPGYFVTRCGSTTYSNRPAGVCPWWLPVPLILMALYMYMNFGTLGNTLLILLNIPLALMGIGAALWLAYKSLSVPSRIGFIALFGSRAIPWR